MASIFELLQELEQSKNGKSTIELMDALLEQDGQMWLDSADSIFDFMVHASNKYNRSTIGFELARLANPGNTKLSEGFRAGLYDSTISSCCILGLLNTDGKKAYPILADLILDHNIDLNSRILAVDLISIASGQPFNRCLPRTLSNWTEDDLRVCEIREWKLAGFPPGVGQTKPSRHPSLDYPLTPLDKLVSALDQKLESVRRVDARNFTNPINYLSPPDESIMTQILTKWPLPDIYSEFLRKFSPHRLECGLRGEDSDFYLSLFGASELEEAQIDYATDPTGTPLPDWPANLVVIGLSDADPWTIDLSGDPRSVPVLFSLHGTDEWEFSVRFPSFLDFLGHLEAGPLPWLGLQPKEIEIPQE